MLHYISLEEMSLYSTMENCFYKVHPFPCCKGNKPLFYSLLISHEALPSGFWQWNYVIHTGGLSNLPVLRISSQVSHAIWAICLQVVWVNEVVAIVTQFAVHCKLWVHSVFCFLVCPICNSNLPTLTNEFWYSRSLGFNSFCMIHGSNSTNLLMYIIP